MAGALGELGIYWMEEPLHRGDYAGMAALRAETGFRIAAAARQAGLEFTSHTWGSGLILLANAHLVIGTGGGPWLEFPFDPPDWVPARRDFCLRETIETDAEGWLVLPDRPGLGALLDEDVLRETRIGYR